MFFHVMPRNYSPFEVGYKMDEKTSRKMMVLWVLFLEWT